MATVLAPAVYTLPMENLVFDEARRYIICHPVGGESSSGIARKLRTAFRRNNYDPWFEFSLGEMRPLFGELNGASKGYTLLKSDRSVYVRIWERDDMVWYEMLPRLGAMVPIVEYEAIRRTLESK